MDTSKLPRVPVPAVAGTSRRASRAPSAPRTSTTSLASNTFAVPLIRTAGPTTSPGSGRSTRIVGAWPSNCPRPSDLPCP